MSKRTYSLNAFETPLTAGATAGGVITIAPSAAQALTEPSYMVVDPESATVREYVRVTAINGTTGELTCDRGLAGSVGDIGHPHDANTSVLRAVAVHQWIDDIFDDVESLEQWDSDHLAAPDPHPVYLTEPEGDASYLKLDASNDPMTADLDMGTNKVVGLGDGDAASQDAAAMSQVEAGDAATLVSANAYSDGLDHDHATPIAAHDVDAGAHPTEFALYLPLTGGTVTGDIDIVGSLSVSVKAVIEDLDVTDEILVGDGALGDPSIGFISATTLGFWYGGGGVYIETSGRMRTKQDSSFADDIYRNISIGGAAPTGANVGDMWFDVGSDAVFAYDGVDWDTIILKGQDYSEGG